MSKVRFIEDKGKRLAIYVPEACWEKGLKFLSEDEDFIQVGLWGYDKDKVLQPHVHNEVERKISRTQEMIFVKSGRVATYIYNEEGFLLERIEMHPGDILVLNNGGHGYEILEDNTYVLEVKNGPYPGAEVDRRRIEWNPE